MTADPAAVTLVSNALTPPPDEGIKKLAQRTAEYLRAQGASVHAVDGSSPFMVRKFFLGRRLLRAIREGTGDIVVYIPTESLTLGSHLRSLLLRLLTRKRVALVAAQPGRSSLAEKLLTRVTGLDMVLTPSPELHKRLEALGLEPVFLPMGTDLPPRLIDRDKSKIRAEYGIPDDYPVVLHVGHIAPLRNLEWLLRLKQQLNVTVLMVASTTFEPDTSVRSRLEDAEVIVVDNYIADIMNIYFASDCYVFPVLNPNGAIGVPLSVLEAMACNLPVVTTGFGGLSLMFEPRDGLHFVKDESSFVEKVSECLAARSTVATSKMVERFTWDKVIERLLNESKRLSA